MNLFPSALDLPLMVASWMVVVVVTLVTLIALWDIRIARRGFFGPGMLGPDYMDAWYATEWYHKVIFVFAVLWLILG